MYESLGTLNFGKSLGHPMTRYVKNKKSIPRLVSKSSLFGFGDDTTTDSTDSTGDGSFDWNAAFHDVTGAASSIVPAVLKPKTTTVYTTPGAAPVDQSSNVIYYVLGAAAIAGGAYFLLKK